jgi:hypothetical protein
MTLARVPWIDSRQWGRDGSDAHATSRNTQTREPSEAELTPAEAFRSRPHENELKDDPHPVSFATDPGKGVLDWYNTVGTHSHVAHATSRNTQIREPSEAELLQPKPSGVDPTNMDSTIFITEVPPEPYDLGDGERCVSPYRPTQAGQVGGIEAGFCDHSRPPH